MNASSFEWINWMVTNFKEFLNGNKCHRLCIRLKTKFRVVIILILLPPNTYEPKFFITSMIALLNIFYTVGIIIACSEVCMYTCLLQDILPIFMDSIYFHLQDCFLFYARFLCTFAMISNSTLIWFEFLMIDRHKLPVQFWLFIVPIGCYRLWFQKEVIVILEPINSFKLAPPRPGYHCQLTK